MFPASFVEETTLPAHLAPTGGSRHLSKITSLSIPLHLSLVCLDASTTLFYLLVYGSFEMIFEIKEYESSNFFLVFPNYFGFSESFEIPFEF